ncbi:MAG: sigma-70 family RNA polymerase sigma factor [Oligoflexia bacterium]|nr:sigma-70 family RNA polymerase sigma factor [Oligoflexia bacterium]
MSIDIEKYYREYAPMVIRRCRYLLGNNERAIEAMQDTFVRLLINKDRLVDTSPSALMLKIATNVCLNLLRKEKHMFDDIPEIADTLYVESKADDIANRQLLIKMFSREKESTAMIAILIFIDEMTLEETAREVGMSVSGVRKRLRFLQGKFKNLKSRYFYE